MTTIVGARMEPCLSNISADSEPMKLVSRACISKNQFLEHIPNSTHKGKAYTYTRILIGSLQTRRKFGFRYMKKPKPEEKHSEKITGTQRDGPRTVAES